MSAPTATPTQVKILDLRSDTVTKPTDAMRQAMATAEVGDDVFGDDPTINLLQTEVATLLGKEAGLFIPSGTMSNLLAALVHVDARGGEMIVGDQAHMFYYEQGNVAQFGGIHSRTVKNQLDGTMDLVELEKAIRPIGDDHLPLTQLITVEQTHNRMGGRILPLEYMDAVGALTKKYKIKFHVDGARLMNAAVALGIDAKRLVASADSVSLCLSKGLGAPVGSVLVGTTDFIRKARRLRKALGGGMRQAGILAAAGLISIRDQVAPLALDHTHAKQIAEGLRSVRGFIVPPIATVETNLLFVELDSNLFVSAAQFVSELRTYGLLISATDLFKIRFVTHHQIDDAAIQQLLTIVKEAANMHITKKETTSKQ